MRAFAIVAALAVLGSCTPASLPAATSAAPSVTQRVSATPSAVASPGLAERPIAIFTGNRRWVTVPDGLVKDGPIAIAEFPTVDATPGRPRVRLRSTSRTVELKRGVVQSAQPSPVPSNAQWSAEIPLDGAPVGENTLDLVVSLRDGTEAVVGSWSFLVSMPVYVVWTLDFEGDAATNETMDNAYDIAQKYRAPMTIMWNPRVWTTGAVSQERAMTMRSWTMNIHAAGYAEVALHLHAWTDYVRSAGVAPRTAPSWAGRGDGYDVPLTAFTEDETRKLIDHALALMAQLGMPRPTSFRAGGLFANAANLRAVASAGFTVDASATPAGPFGSLPLPWTLAKGAQPYRPSATDANASGDLPLLEVPNNAGNTFGHTAASIQRVIDDDLAMLPAAGATSAVRRTLTLVSHPATIDATERAAIEKLFAAFEPYRWDRDTGPLRFVTLSQLAAAYR